MKELKELQLQKENAEKNTEDSGKKDAVKNSSMIASNEMCTFLIINVSSLQADSREYDRLSGEIWKCGSDGNRRTGNSCHRCQHCSGSDFL